MLPQLRPCPCCRGTLDYRGDIDQARREGVCWACATSARPHRWPEHVPDATPYPTISPPATPPPA